MTGIEASITQLLLDISHYPFLLYFGIALIFLASSFGLPLPEEVVLITSGFIANLAMVESLQTGQPPRVDPYFLATYCFICVFGTDLIVFSLGKRFGPTLLSRKPFNLIMPENALAKVQASTQKYGLFACAIFRFTPGIRFPGHFMCGAMGISYFKFTVSDGAAALLSVPTQVLLVAFYGQEILKYFTRFKFVIIILLVAAFLFWIIRHRIKSSTKAAG